jgi:magnesium transporter
VVLEVAEPRFRWLDLVDPDAGDLQALAQEFGIHQEAVRDCLDPEHLPKFERLGEVVFIIARAWDESAPATGDSVQALTRKVALFVGPDFLLTIHRKPQPYLAALCDEVHAAPERNHVGELVYRVLDAAVLTYETPLQRVEDALDRWHDALFGRGRAPALEELATLKRQANLYKRMLWSTLQAFQRFAPANDRHVPVCQSLIEDTQSLHFWADELLDEANNLMQLQFSLSAHRTNEVVKVLTIFSAFFMPLTFLVGVYGMNFHHMPELDWPLGYYWAWGVMAALTGAIWLWFRRRGWL